MHRRKRHWVHLVVLAGSTTPAGARENAVSQHPGQLGPQQPPTASLLCRDRRRLVDSFLKSSRLAPALVNHPRAEAWSSHAPPRCPDFFRTNERASGHSQSRIALQRQQHSPPRMLFRIRGSRKRLRAQSSQHSAANSGGRVGPSRSTKSLALRGHRAHTATGQRIQHHPVEFLASQISHKRPDHTSQSLGTPESTSKDQNAALLLISQERCGKSNR